MFAVVHFPIRRHKSESLVYEVGIEKRNVLLYSGG
jgi:hypothetical protein